MAGCTLSAVGVATSLRGGKFSSCVKLEVNPGEEYMFRERALGTGAITEIFSAVHSHYKDLPPGKIDDPIFAKTNLPFAGNLYMGHLRYSTTGNSGISYVHPFLRRNNWRAKNLAICGNFNLTNVQEVFNEITSIGQHPRAYADTFIMLEQMGHRLDREVERLYKKCEDEGLKGMDLTHGFVENKELVLDDVDKALNEPTDRRIFVISKALRAGYTIDQIYDLTKIDRWFIQKLSNIMVTDKELRTYRSQTEKAAKEADHHLFSLFDLDFSKESTFIDLVHLAKRQGFSDFQISRALGFEDDVIEQGMMQVRQLRKEHEC